MVDTREEEFKNIIDDGNTLNSDHNALVAFRLASKLVKDIQECLDENDTNTKQVAVFLESFTDTICLMSEMSMSVWMSNKTYHNNTRRNEM